MDLFRDPLTVGDAQRLDAAERRRLGDDLL
jgi:hypothetical protein